MYFIIKGKVGIISSEGIHLATLGSGKNFGEMAILKEGDVRSASVQAETDVSVAMMSTYDFKKICDLYQSFKTIITQVVIKRKVQNMQTRQKVVERTKKLSSRTIGFGGSTPKNREEARLSRVAN